MTEQKRTTKDQLIAWGILLVIVWFFGTMFLNAASQTGKRPSDELKPKAADETKNEPTTSNSPKTIGKLQILQPGLNLRSKPEKNDNNVIKTLNKGDILQIVTSIEGWYEVISGTQKGFVTNNPQYIKVLNIKK